MKKKSLVVIILCTFLLNGCGTIDSADIGGENKSDDTHIEVSVKEGNREEGPDEDIQMPDRVLYGYEERYDMEELGQDVTGIETPCGMCIWQEKLFVCDYDNHCIVQLDLQGKPMSTYGKLGSAEGEFVHPTAMTVWEDKLYVLDSGNLRAQVYDKDMQLIEVISLWNDQSTVMYDEFRDIAVDGEGNIYVCTDAVMKDAARIFCVSKGVTTPLNQVIQGYLAQGRDGTVYAVDAVELSVVEENYKWRACTGNNYLYQVTKEGVMQLAELPFMYAPMDFVVVEEEFYTVSCTWGQINKISMEGELLEAVYNLKPDFGPSTGYIVEYNGEFWVGISDNGVIYHFTEK
ncbi:MAG: hypothetical protein IJ282_02570 [Lachnospiraceae bacterium]|nr:hypothetical protein [Lachnospiraceae bacterium]